jgi:glycosyltransferase involved in cell wall biosynthesis
VILLISGVFPPEPVVSASISYDLASAMAETTDVTVISPGASRPKGFIFRKGPSKKEKFKHVVLDSFTYPDSKIIGRIRESYSFGKHSARYILENRTEINCIYLNTWPLIAQYLVVRVALKCSIPIVIHVQDIYPESLLDKLPVLKAFFIKLLLPVDRYILKNASKVVTISPKMKSVLTSTRGLNVDAVDVVYNWQDEKKFIDYFNSEKPGVENHLFTFMYLGTLNLSAAVDKLISAFRKSDLKNSRLVLAGAGPEKDTLVSDVTLHGDSNIEFWDAPLMKVPEIQDKANVLLLNLKAGVAMLALPSKLPAYMLSSKPVIACVEEGSGIANAVLQADCGWIVPPGNEDALSETMKAALFMRKDDLMVMGSNGFKYALENFSRETNLRKLTGIIYAAAKM